MPSPFETGAIVALRYQIIAPLGRGGMAQVYRARHLPLGRDVALKVMHGENASVSYARFAREARNMAALDHPGCVRVVDFGASIDGTRFLVMDLVEGNTLAEVLRTTPVMNVDRAMEIADALLAALHHAHTRGVIHRDIKPANVMIGRDGRVVLIDFGLSEAASDAAITALGSCVGSPSYLAPERLLGDDYDHRSDLYAVGLMLYEMLAGTRAFVGATPIDIARAQIECAPRPIGHHRADMSTGLAEVIHRAISKRPEQRFGDANAMRTALAYAATHARAARVERQRRSLATPYPYIRPPALPAEAAARTTAFLAQGRRGLLASVWAWLRFGRWRWRDGARPLQSAHTAEVSLF